MTTRLTITLLLLALAAGGLSCFGDDGPGLPAAPAGYEVLGPGSFRMGEPGLIDPLDGTRRVTLTRPWVLARYEVTLDDYVFRLNTAWLAGEVDEFQGWLYDTDSDMPLVDLDLVPLFYDALPDTFTLTAGANPYAPVTGVTWYGAALYCDWLNAEQGLAASYTRDGYDWPCGPNGNPYAADGWRLPTEAEWEFAVRGWDGRSYPWGDGDPNCDLCNGSVAPGGGSCVGDIASVGSTSPLGDTIERLADMAGNAREWCQDWYADWASYDPLEDPVDTDSDPFSATEKCLRGGDFSSGPVTLAAWNRDRMPPELTHRGVGFRVARRWPPN
ncbi:MAG: formylglycine-generating enzyme family protein [Candidatus Krumholzibacteriia bacterium]